MIYILLSILSSTAILIIFRLLPRFSADSRQTIMFSYLISVLVSVVAFSPSLASFANPLFLLAALEGIAFYVVFRLMAVTTEVNGISVASIASKMSVVLPISIGIAVLGERVNAFVIAGIVSGLIAVIFSSGLLSSKKSSVKASSTASWRWPLLVFLGTGLIDTSLNLFQLWGLTEADFPSFMMTIFGFAFLTGIMHHFSFKDKTLTRSSMIASCFLGVANLGTVYFVLLALAVPSLLSSFVYSMNNFGVVLASTLVAVLLFREKLSAQAYIGLVLAVLAIVLLYLGAT